jgi:ElaA protein
MSLAPVMDWQLLPFDALSARQLHDLLQLRSAVFVVEQACVFQDIDGADPLALHLLGHRAGQLLAYARCFAPGLKCAEASIGRVITVLEHRGTGLGHALMRQALESVAQRWGPQPVRIGAQARLKQFYVGHGFVDLNRPYIEDGIAHLEMLRPAAVISSPSTERPA